MGIEKGHSHIQSSLLIHYPELQIHQLQESFVLQFSMHSLFSKVKEALMISFNDELFVL